MINIHIYDSLEFLSPQMTSLLNGLPNPLKWFPKGLQHTSLSDPEPA